ncbi:hypothetical protein KC099_10875 [Acinetobacter nosocomialis]|uniref:hypothetical protein n=1 Tax=Acinetobacter nosocomialis TaxID=106654 RepID=UPI001B83E72B|nr:hypothetical protein [Acinetobacter nosocomialis]MBR7713699.1 hypothetical protein [Acinetobacter nosocomialis]
MNLSTREKLIKDWKNMGIQFFEETIWTSSILQKDLQKVRAFLKKNGYEHFDISIVRPQVDYLGMHKWKYHYDTNGHCISTNYQIAIPANTNHLKLIIGLIEINSNQELQNLTFKIINALRVIFGVPIASDLMLINTFSIDDSKGSTSSELGFASPFHNQSLNMFPDIEDVKIRNLPVEASIFIDKALQQKFPHERFILLWTAFEIIINSIEGLGSDNGSKRKNYFERELGSSIINDEVFRLFKDVRCQLFKEGKFSNLKNMENDNWSLYAALQLLLMEDCEPRTKFLKGYEQSLLSPS